jgi:hypothetical protein
VRSKKSLHFNSYIFSSAKWYFSLSFLLSSICFCLAQVLSFMVYFFLSVCLSIFHLFLSHSGSLFYGLLLSFCLSIFHLFLSCSGSLFYGLLLTSLFLSFSCHWSNWSTGNDLSIHSAATILASIRRFNLQIVLQH